MKVAKIGSLLGVLAMAVALIYAFAVGDFAGEGAALLAMPWGVVSLVDLYVGFSLFAGWIIYRERSPWVAAVWVVLLLVLGFFVGSLYVFLALLRSNNDWKQFWLGARG